MWNIEKESRDMVQKGLEFIHSGEEELQKKGKQRDIDAYHALIEKNIKERDETIKEILADEYKVEVKNVFEYTYPELGVTPDEQDMVFNVTFSADGLVKRAGSNYILDAGKLIGNQFVISEEDRKRNMDAYLPGGRFIQYDITIMVPQGYAAEGLDKLTRNIDNEYSQFLSSATVNGDQINITVQKVYKKDFIPVSDWMKLVEMLDAANEFYAQSIIFRKTN